MAKRSFVATILGLVLLVTVACSISMPVTAFTGNRVYGSGNVVEETREVSNFNGVLLEGSGNLFIEQGDTESLRIEAEDNIIPLMDISVQGDRLVIGFKNDANFINNKPMNFYLTVKSLQSLDLTGSGNATVNSLKATDLAMTISGSGNIHLDDLQAQSIKAHLFGSGNVDATGKVQDQSIEISGSGSYDAVDLQSATASVGSTGSGQSRLSVSDQLDVRITGSGSVEYKGSPRISTTILGSGDVTQIK